LVLIICLLTVVSQGTTQTIDPAPKMWRSHKTDIPIASPLVSQTPVNNVETETVTYGMIDNQNLTGYLAYPTGKPTSLPALIVIHEWWGLNDNIKAMSDRLAQQGYIALAVDLYNGEVASNPEKARELVNTALADPQQLEENLTQAYNYLEKERKAPKIASIGWCFGGTWSLNTAKLFPQQLDAAVIYYGGNIDTDTENLKDLQMPILGIFGELDDNPSPETVKKFEASLKSLGITNEIYIYPNADHAFANPSGTRYNEQAAEDAWAKTMNFLNKYLKS
jgi:carboxymethylenebutenolidase